MVYSGKPSKGCQTCRTRKIRCGQEPDGCSQCAKAKFECPGYRDQLDLIFRNENTQVARKSKAAKGRGMLQSPKDLQSASSSTSPHDPGIGSSEPAERQRARFPTPKISRSNPSPTIDERATSFFFDNYVIGADGPSRGHLDHLQDIKAYQMDENLLYSIKAVGLAALSGVSHAPNLMQDARQHYLAAIRLTNAALKSPVEVKKDSTLLAIMVLGIFETVTGCNQRSLTAWASHINGATALLKLRGFEQLSTSAGRRLFIQITASLIISCIQRTLPLPDHVLRLRQELANYMDPREPAWRVHQYMADFTSFRAQVKDGTLSDSHLILARSLELDGLLLSVFSNVPPGWEYQTVLTGQDSHVVFGGCYHVYCDVWVARIWNAVRSLRIMLHQQVHNILLQGFTARPPYFIGEQFTAQFQKTTETLYELQNEILYSVPQHMGYAPKARSATSGTSNSAPPVPEVASNAGPAGLDQPVVRASGGYLLLWPLFMAGAMEISTESVRRWIIQTLKCMAQTMGVQQAALLADILEYQMTAEVWKNQKKEALAWKSQPAVEEVMANQGSAEEG